MLAVVDKTRCATYTLIQAENCLMDQYGWYSAFHKPFTAPRQYTIIIFLNAETLCLSIASKSEWDHFSSLALFLFIVLARFFQNLRLLKFCTRIYAT